MSNLSGPRLNVDVSFLVIYLSILFLILSGAFFMRLLILRALTNDKSDELVTHLKAKEKQIDQWRQERTADANYLLKTPVIKELSRALIEYPQSAEIADKLAAQLMGMYENNQYTEMVLTDSSNNGLFSLPRNGRIIAGCGYGFGDNILTCQISDIYLNNKDEPELCIMVPVTNSNETRFAGGLFLKIDPEKHLFQKLQKSPVSYRTLETILFRNIGDSVQVLNRLRFSDNKALNFKYPVNKLHGKAIPEQRLKIRDYRNKDVLAATTQIEGTTWHLIVKMDMQEVKALQRPLLIAVWISAGLTAMLAYFVMLLMVTRRQALVEARQHRMEQKHQAERKSIEMERKEVEDKYLQLFLNTNNAVTLLQATVPENDFILTDINPKAESIEGVNRDDAIGKKLSQMAIGIADDKLRQPLQRVLEKDLPLHIPLLKVMHKGVEQWREYYIYKLPTGEIVVVYNNITGQQKMIEELRLNEERLRLALKASNQGIYDLNLQTGETVVTPEYETMFGYVPGELKETHKKWQDRLHPDDVEIVRKAYEDYVSGRTPEYRVEFRQKTKQGGYIWILALGEVISYDGQGKPLRMLGTHTNITQKKETELALARSELLLRQTGSISKVGGWEFDPQTGEGSWTEEVALIHDLDPHAKTNKEIGLSFYHGKSRTLIEKAIAQAIEKGESYDLELEMVSAKGNIKWVRTIGLPEVVNSKTVKVRGAFQDITDRKLSEEAIKTLNAELEQRVMERTAELALKNRELETFTYSVSHDLKSPLRGIEGYSRLFEEEHGAILPQEAKYYLQRICESAAQMNQLIEDLLSYSRIEKMQPTLTATSLNILIINIVDRLLSDHPTFKTNWIKINMPEENYLIDAEGITIIIRNLLDNALKFVRKNAKPLVEIGHEKKDGSLLFFVKDNGSGFENVYRDRIFEIFQRLHRMEDYPGTGIGLAMVRKAAERMGARVWAEGNPGKGAQFFVELPLDKITVNQTD